MCTAGFPEPLTFSLRAARHAAPPGRRVRRRPRQPVAGLGAAAAASAPGCPTVATVHHPIAIDRRLELAAAPVAAPAADPAPLVRASPACRRGWRRRLDAVTTVSENSRRDIATDMGLPAAGIEVIPVGIDPDEFTPPPAGQPRDPDSILVDHQRRRRRSRAWCTCSRRWPSCAPSGRCGSPSSAPPAPAARPRPRSTGSALRDAVRFTGPVPAGRARRRCCSAAAVVAIPSLYEGFSLPAIEAMACAHAAGHHRRRRAARGGRHEGGPAGPRRATSAS